MAEDISFNNIFHYLEKESIPFDKDEFLFQIQSHPDYPSLLSVADTLNFFKIPSGAIPVTASQIEMLPDRFMALLTEATSDTQLYFVDRKGEKYLTVKDKTTYEIDRETLESRWQDLVFLVEKPDSGIVSTPKSSKTIKALSFICLVTVLTGYFMSYNSISALGFVLFPIIGFLFSIAALKDLFGTKSTFIASFCKISTSTDCTAVVSSNKWKIFEIVNFSDLSLVFFTSQLLGLLLLNLSGSFLEFFAIQKLILLGSVPVIALSLYYQKFVEKKWCPICLVIADIIGFQITYLFLLVDTDTAITSGSLFIYSQVILISTALWMMLKRILSAQRDLKEAQVKANRLVRNYTVFKNTLITSPKVEVPDNIGVYLGNIESEAQITIITNPFCGHCEEVHETINAILEDYGDQLRVKVLFKTSFELDNEETKEFFRKLMTIYLKNGEQEFKDALGDFFKSKDVALWNQKYQVTSIDEETDTIYAMMNDWTIEQDVNYTPEIYLNGYKYPGEYEREHLSFYMDEFIEDENF